MLRTLLIAAAMVAVASSGVIAASTATMSASRIHTSSSGFGHDARAALRSGAGYSGRPTSSLATGANPLPRFGGHESSGWNQRGFGGTLNPGWGYNFGPNLGGFSH